MAYPIELKLKCVPIATAATLFDSQGQSIAYARRKVVTLFNETIEVFRDKSRSDLICTIKQVNNGYRFFDKQQETFGALQGDQLLDAQGNEHATIELHEPPFRFWHLFPFSFRNYQRKGSVLVTYRDKQETLVIRVTKSDGFSFRALSSRPWGLRFNLEKLSELTPDEDMRCLMSLLIMTFFYNKYPDC